MGGKKIFIRILIYVGFSLLIASPFIVGSIFIPNKVAEWVVFGFGLFIALFLAGIIDNKLTSKQKNRKSI